jgi:GH35 family endo-1,4-beta-xylanase
MDQKYLLEHFDKLSEFVEPMIDAEIERNRKGLFCIKVLDKSGAPVKGARVRARLKKHEFKFGCAAFLLDQFPDERRNSLYRELFADTFNYAVVPLYWDTLEPEEGHPRFDKNSKNVYRRPALDLIKEYCKENGIGMKGHCLMYNSFNPKWMPRDFRSLKMAVEKRSREISERYGEDFVDLDVINEMYTVYRNAHGEYGMRDLPICDDKDHEKWCFDIAKKYFPYSRLFWNEGCYESFGDKQYTGDKSVYYLMLKRWIAAGAPIEGIGMQYHAFHDNEDQQRAIFNPYRAMDIFKLYSEFGLPIHISEVSIPSYSNEKQDEQVQAELLYRMYRLWFSQERIESIVWWNMVDGTAYGDENRFFAGLLRNDMTKKPAFEALHSLIHKEWQTDVELTTDENGRAYFKGFYGDYEIALGNEAEVRRFYKENTGYYNVTKGPMEQRIIL